MERTDIIPPVTLLDKASSIEDLRIDPTKNIEEPPVLCYIAGSPAMTAGNFSLINGKAKSGKTFFLGAIVASLISDTEQLDNIKGCIPEGNGVVLYYDTEQSEFHATRTIKRICKMAGIQNPGNLIAYGLRPLTPAERVQVIEDKILNTDNLVAVVIDGIRDLLTYGINDEQEATVMTSKLLKWSSDKNIHIIILLHQNKTDMNARGHIGTEILNKAETTLTVTKDTRTDSFVVSCDYSRDIGFEDFSFRIEDGLPVAASMPREEKARGNKPQHIEDDRHFIALNNIFREDRRLSYRDLMDKIIGGFENSFGESACRTFITHYMNKGWISKYNEGNKKYYRYERAVF